MNPKLQTVTWAVGGLALAGLLSLSAFAVAGGRISEPAGSVHLVVTSRDDRQGSPSPSVSTRQPGEPSDTTAPSAATPTQTSVQPSPTDDHGGGSGDTSHGGDDN